MLSILTLDIDEKIANYKIVERNRHQMIIYASIITTNTLNSFSPPQTPT